MVIKMVLSSFQMGQQFSLTSAGITEIMGRSTEFWNGF